MSLRDLKSKSASALDAIPKEHSTNATLSLRPVTAPGATAMMQPTIDALNDRAKVAELKANEAEKRLTEVQARLNDFPKELPLDALVEVQGRRRNLTPDQFDELRANLAVNPLVHAIAVKKMLDGRYEVISGHNRLAAYRILGRQTIPVSVIDIEDNEVERSAFFANLLQPSLPDYERYLGFKKWQDETGETQSAMAERSGASRPAVSRLFAFSELPERALELIADKPDCIGASCVEKLARLAKAGRAENVIEAVHQLASGEISQKEAEKLAAKSDQKTRIHDAGVAVKVKSGRLEYCRYVAKGGTLKIDFNDAQERIAAEDAIAKVLQDLAERARAS